MGTAIEEKEEKLQCSKCKGFFEPYHFTKVHTSQDRRRRMYGYKCSDCKADEQKTYRAKKLAEDPNYYRKYSEGHKGYKASHREELKQSDKYYREYFRYLQEPCDRHSGCSKFKHHWGYCKVNGQRVMLPEVREMEHQRQLAYQRKKYGEMKAAEMELAAKVSRIDPTSPPIHPWSRQSHYFVNAKKARSQWKEPEELKETA